MGARGGCEENLYTNHNELSPTFDKGRGLVGYFNSSTVEYNEEVAGLHACQKSAGVPQNKLTQDVKTVRMPCQMLCAQTRSHCCSTMSATQLPQRDSNERQPARSRTGRSSIN
eukprot:4849000-Prymnesium_polylepis.1